MKKTLIALMALAGIATGAVESGSYTLKMEQWTTGDSTLYDYLNGAINEGGTLTLSLKVNYTGENCGVYQTLLHVGQKDTGFTIFANGGPRIIVGENHSTDDATDNHELSTDVFSKGLTDIIVTITGNQTPGTAAVAITLNGVEYSKAAGTEYVNDLDWGTMGWSTTADERNKYSVNVGAPGWDTYLPASSTTLVSGTATYKAIPEPTTATLSLLALAGLAVRRRRASR